MMSCQIWLVSVVMGFSDAAKEWLCMLELIGVFALRGLLYMLTCWSLWLVSHIYHTKLAQLNLNATLYSRHVSRAQMTMESVFLVEVVTTT